MFRNNYCFTFSDLDFVWQNKIIQPLVNLSGKFFQIQFVTVKFGIGKMADPVAQIHELRI